MDFELAELEFTNFTAVAGNAINKRVTPMVRHPSHMIAERTAVAGCSVCTAVNTERATHLYQVQVRNNHHNRSLRSSECHKPPTAAALLAKTRLRPTGLTVVAGASKVVRLRRHSCAPTNNRCTPEPFPFSPKV